MSIIYPNTKKIQIYKEQLHYWVEEQDYVFPLNAMQITLLKMPHGNSFDIALRFFHVQLEIILLKDHLYFQEVFTDLMKLCGYDQPKIDEITSCRNDVKLYPNISRELNKPVEKPNSSTSSIYLRGFPICINGLSVPYEATEAEIEEILCKPIAQYILGVCVLAYLGTQKSYLRLLQELKHRDPFKRRATLEYLARHSMWNNDLNVIRAALLDKSQYIVSTALNIVLNNNLSDLDEEVIDAYLRFPNHETTHKYSEEYFSHHNISKDAIAQRALENNMRDLATNDEPFDLGSQDLYENTDIGQNTPWASKNNPEKYRDYVRILQKYDSSINETKADTILQNLSKYGCGYASFIVTLMHQYENSPISFLQTFNIPYYDKSNVNNGDDLVVEMYGMCGMKAQGLSIPHLFINIEKFKKYYDIPVDTRWLFHPNNFLEKENSYVLMVAGDFDLIDQAGYVKHVNEYHFMNLLGFTPGGDYEVISWGKEYICKKSSITGKTFFVGITYKE